MTDIVNCAGRHMTGQLQSALDNMTASDRRVLVRVLESMPDHSTSARLYKALVIELQLCGLRELETDREFRQITQDSIGDDRPWPKATGPAMRLDPETGEVFEIPHDSTGDES